MFHEQLHELFNLFLPAMVGGIVALTLNEALRKIRQNRDRRELAKLCVNHLRLIADAIPHVKRDEISEDYIFSETNFAELTVGHFLYELITSNIALFDVKKLGSTIKFFHGYKVQMSNIRTRLDQHAVKLGQLKDSESPNLPVHPTASLTRKTFEGLLNDLELSVQELSNLACANTNKLQ